MANSANRKVISYVGDISDIKSKLKQLNNLNKRVGQSFGKDINKNLKSVKNTANQLTFTKTTAGFQKLANTASKTTQIIKGTNGALTKMTTTSKINAAGIKTTTTAYSNMSKNTVGLAANLGRLAKRAALTIPLWMALRGTMMLVTRTIRDSFKAIIDQDRALQKAKRNLQGTTEEISANFKTLQDEALKLSLKTGVSVGKIVTAFQRFATTGLDFETSMAGANASVKTAVLLFGDTEKIANALARAFRVLGGRTDKFESQGQELTATLAQVAELWKDNAFEISEFNGAIERFAPTARTANVSLEETVTLLAVLQTAGIRGTRAGRLLSTAILQMEKNFDKFNDTLGVNLSSVDSTFDRLRLIIGAIDDLNRTNPVAASQAISSLFRIRGGNSIRALASLKDALDEATNKTGDIQKMNTEFEEQNKQINRLADQFKNTRTEIGKAFLIGVTGGKDFRDSLEKIVETMKGMQAGARNAGIFLNAMFAPARGETFIDALTKGYEQAQAELVGKFVRIAKLSREAMENGLSEVEFTELSKKIHELSKDFVNGPEIFGKENLQNLKHLKSIHSTLEQQFILQQKITDEKKKQNNVDSKEIAVSFLLDSDKQDIIKQVRAKASQEEKQRREELNKLGVSAIEIEKRLLKYKIEQGMITSHEIDLQKDVITHMEKMEGIELRRTRAKGVVQNQIQDLKLRGATNLQLLKTQRTLENMYGINQSRNAQLQYELKLQQEITKERNNQNTLSSTSMKLYQIAQEQGRRPANAVSSFLQGNTSLDAFESGGKYSGLMSTLEKYFKAELTQRQAQRYFYEGSGSGLNIPERSAMTNFRPASLESISLPSIETNVGGIKIELKQALSREQLTNQIMSQLGEALETNETIKMAIENIIENY